MSATEDKNKFALTEEIIERARRENALNQNDDGTTEKLHFTEEEKKIVAEENYRLNYYVVCMFTKTVVNDDLLSAAILGYAKAIESFDKNREVKFSTYAINCIRNEILFHLRKEKKHEVNTISMNTTLSVDKDGNDLTLEETILNKEKSEDTTEKSVIINEEVKSLHKALDMLDKREKYIIIRRYGLDNKERATQKELAKEINMSQANISKIEKVILIKLKQILRDKFKMTNTFVDKLFV